MELGNMKIGQRLFAGFGIVLLLMVALGIVSYLQMGTMYVIVVTGLAIVVGIGTAIITTRSITNPLNEVIVGANKIRDGDFGYDIRIDSKDELGDLARTFGEMKGNLQALVDDAGMLADAGAEGKLDVRADASKHSGDFRKIVEEMNNMLDGVNRPLKVVIEYIDRISRGDMPEKSTGNARGVFIEVQRIMNQCIDAINAMMDDTNMLAQAGVEGRLDVRADASKHEGDFGKIIQGVNDLIDAVAVPVNEVMRVVNAYAEGELDARGQIDVQGEFKVLGETLDQFGDALQGIVKDIGRVTGKIAEGDLTAVFEAETPGEFSEIKDNLDQANMALSGLVSGLQNTIHGVAAISEESAASNEEMNSGMEQIGSASQEIAQGAQNLTEIINSSVKELKDTSAMFQEMDSAIGESNNLTENGVELVQHVGEVSQNARVSANEINDAITESLQVIGGLNDAVQKIGNVTDAIKDIADQTNLLALNAAIEAARAGEHGKGFAVVAEEVRKLAEESRTSTEDIAILAKDVQKEMADVVSSSQGIADKSVGVIDVSKEAANGAAEAVTAMNELACKLQEVAAGSKQGSVSIERLAKGADEMASTSEETASASEETSSAVEEQLAAVEELSAGSQHLAEQAQSAMELLDQFKVIEGAS
ncbi:MAG: methyl-accepting chemotaxis protein [archaeon]|nr:methyl-accepting chemotaxis protein [archaeon]